MTSGEIKNRIIELEKKTGWYQDIDFGDGLHTKTKSFWGEDMDHPKSRWTSIAPAIPQDLTGKSVLDIGCNAGFICFEAKKRGATDIVGMDLKSKYIEQANFCNEVLDAGIKFEVGNITDTHKLGRKFDFVFFIGLLYHCKYIRQALEQICQVATDTLICESAIIMDKTDVPLVRFVNDREYVGPTSSGAKRLPGHWHPNMSAMREFFYAEGFNRVENVFAEKGRGAVIAYRK